VNHFSINELLQPLEQMASLCNMQYLPPYVLFGARTALEESRIDSHIKKWIALLNSMVNDEFDFKFVDRTRLLNSIDTTIGIDK
jgi:hypothetical protein